MTVSPAGILSETQGRWRSMIAKTYAFQNWAGSVWNEATALTHIYHDLAPLPAGNSDQYSEAELEAIAPFAVVWTDEFQAVVDGVGAYPEMQGRGVLVAEFYRIAGEAIEDQDLTFRNWIGQLLMTGNLAQPGLVELQATAGLIQLSRLSAVGPTHNPPQYMPWLRGFQRMLISAAWDAGG